MQIIMHNVGLLSVFNDYWIGRSTFWQRISNPIKTRLL